MRLSTFFVLNYHAIGRITNLQKIDILGNIAQTVEHLPDMQKVVGSGLAFSTLMSVFGETLDALFFYNANIQKIKIIYIVRVEGQSPLYKLSIENRKGQQ